MISVELPVTGHFCGRKEGDGLPGPDEAVLCGRLKNLESLRNRNTLLEVSKRDQLVDLIRLYLGLFGDTPTRTHLLEHNIDVGDCKSKCLDAEVKY